jgi:hypothetical protein
LYEYFKEVLDPNPNAKKEEESALKPHIKNDSTIFYHLTEKKGEIGKSTI